MLQLWSYALVLLIALLTCDAPAQDSRISAPLSARRTELGLQTFQQAITSVGFHCPVVQRVTTEIDNVRGDGPTKFVYRVQCRELGSLDADPNLTYRVQQLDAERRFSIRLW